MGAIPLIPQIVEARRSRGEASRADSRALRRSNQMRRGLRYELVEEKRLADGERNLLSWTGIACKTGHYVDD